MTHARLATASLAALAVLGVTSTAGCSGGSGGSGDGGVTAVAAASAPAAGSELDAAAFASALKRPGTIILDVRTPEEFAAGHLAGAVNVDVNGADFLGALAGYDKTVPYAVYCRSGNRSGTAVRLMAEAGFTAAYHLGGGIGAWQDAGGEVVTGA